ncbi:hypothetical protein ACHAPT_013235 [Fusarium lateritium]
MNSYEPLPSLAFRSSPNNNNNNNNNNAAGQQQQQDEPRPFLLPVRRQAEPRLLWVDVSGQQLAPYVHNTLQRGVLALPGRPVTFLRDRVRLDQVTSKRDSYVNAFLIQSRGVRIDDPCSECLRKMSRDSSSYARPFPHCIRLPGHFSGCCGNCKWTDHAGKCNKQDEAQNAWVPAPQRFTYAAAPPAQPAAGSRDDVPIFIDTHASSVLSEDGLAGLPDLQHEEVIAINDDGGDQDPEPKDDDDDDDDDDNNNNAMDLVPIVDDGSAGADTAKDPIRLD